MHALVDSDTPIYNSALVCENDTLAIAKYTLDKQIDRLLTSVGCTTFSLFVSAGNNFRKEIDRTYKANRKGKQDPKYREDLRLHLIDKWKAIPCDGYEADDACGCEQTKDTIIVGIDKDLLQIPGKHYRWPIVRKGQIIRQEEFLHIDEETGFRNFFTQMLTGDTSDNIVGVEGIGAKKAAFYLQDAHTEQDMYDIVNYFYTSSLEHDEENRCCNIERFFRNLDLLWIWRSYGITYSIRKEINDCNIQKTIP
jgi:5'-3' exonuclease